jgi:hypothetical protein
MMQFAYGIMLTYFYIYDVLIYTHDLKTKLHVITNDV